MMKLTNEQEIMKLLFKDFLSYYNSRSMSKIIGISHAGAFKILKRLEEKEFVIGKRIGKAVVYSLNFRNPVLCKEIESILTIEAQNYRRWIEEFRKLENKIDFVILFGSIMRDEKSARDIDILVVADKENYSEVRKIINERNQISNRKIHLIFQSSEEFKKDVLDRNKAIIDIIKTGIVLFGQNKVREALAFER